MVSQAGEEGERIKKMMMKYSRFENINNSFIYDAWIYLIINRSEETFVLKLEETNWILKSREIIIIYGLVSFLRENFAENIQ